MTSAQQQAVYRQHLRFHRQQERVALRIILARFGQMQQQLTDALSRGSMTAVLGTLNFIVTEDMHLSMLSAVYVSVGVLAAEREYDRLVPPVKADVGAVLTKDRSDGIPRPTPVDVTSGRDLTFRGRLTSLLRGSDTVQRVKTMTARTVDVIRSVLTKAVDQGLTAVSVIRQLRRVVVDRSRARLIATTEVTRAINVGAEVGAETTNLVLHKQWIALRDNRTRRDHSEMLGKPPIPVTDLFVVGGRAMKYPGDPAGGAKQCINCRCVCRYDTLFNLTN